MLGSIKVTFKKPTNVDVTQNAFVTSTTSNDTGYFSYTDSASTNPGTFYGDVTTAINSATNTLATKIAPGVSSTGSYTGGSIAGLAGSELIDAYLGNGSLTGIRDSELVPLREQVLEELKQKVLLSLTGAISYYNASMTGANEHKDAIADLKAPIATADILDLFAKVVSEAIEFGDDYAGYNGRVQGVSFGDDMYAPNLSAVITTAAAIDFVPANFSGNIYFDEYARVYYAVNGANNNRIIHKTMGYTPRFAGLGTAQLGGGNYQIYPNDNVKMGSATLLLAHRIAVPENGYFKTIAEGLGTPTTYTAVPSNSGSLGSIFYIPKSGNGGVGNFYVYKDTEAEVYKPIYKLVAGLYNLVQGEGYSVSEFLTMSGTTAVADYYYGNGLSGFGVTGGVPEGYMMRLFRGYKAELVLPGSVANDSDPKIYYVSSQDRFYVYQSRNVNSLANDTHGGPDGSYTDVFTDARDKTKGFYQLYTRYGKLMINISGAGTGASGKMSVTDLLKMDSYYWTGEELTTAQATTLSIPSDIFTNPEYVVPRA